MQIQISWLLQRPTDLYLHCLLRQGISGFSRTRVKSGIRKKPRLQMNSCLVNLYVLLLLFSGCYWIVSKSSCTVNTWCSVTGNSYCTADRSFGNWERGCFCNLYRTYMWTISSCSDNYFRPGMLLYCYFCSEHTCQQNAQAIILDQVCYCIVFFSILDTHVNRKLSQSF